MSPSLASLGFYAFIVWLFIKDRKWNASVSNALWVPLAWAFIIGSKPISMWRSGGGEASDDYIEGSPFDRQVFLLLIAIAIVILVQRKINWGSFFRQNRWLCIYFLYLGISVVWSDYPFVSLKRWIKDVGNLLMLLIILTEKKPVEAIRAFLGRTIYLLVPLSVLLVKYYPETGVAYNRWTYQRYVTGVTTDKNLLGMVLYVAGLALFWILYTLRKEKWFKRDKVGMLSLGLVGLMTLWLLAKVQSSTAVGSVVLAVGIFLALQLPAVKRRVKNMGVYTLLAIVVIAVSKEFLVSLLGRDLTFTGRTDIWEAVLKEPVNPLLGTGFYSFWLGDRVDRLSEKYFYHLNQAHNGYIETYLNSGLIGLILLAVLFVVVIRRARKEVLAGSEFGAFRLAYLATALLYNMTEATFDRLNLVWFVLLLMFMEYARPVNKAGTQASSAPLKDGQERAPESKTAV